MIWPLELLAWSQDILLILCNFPLHRQTDPCRVLCLPPIVPQPESPACWLTAPGFLWPCGNLEDPNCQKNTLFGHFWPLRSQNIQLSGTNRSNLWSPRSHTMPNNCPYTTHVAEPLYRPPAAVQYDQRLYLYRRTIRSNVQEKLVLWNCFKKFGFKLLKNLYLLRKKGSFSSVFLPKFLTLKITLLAQKFKSFSEKFLTNGMLTIYFNALNSNYLKSRKKNIKL